MKKIDFPGVVVDLGLVMIFGMIYISDVFKRRLIWGSKERKRWKEWKS